VTFSRLILLSEEVAIAMSETTPRLGTERFACPHCGAFAHQYWWDCYARKRDGNSPPKAWRSDEVEKLLEKIKAENKLKPEQIEDLRALWLRDATGEVVISKEHHDKYVHSVGNVHLSSCFSCERTSVWIYDRLVYPVTSPHAPPPNADMPEAVRRDYTEAAEIASLSPRGAAALLRLAIQRLMPHLGQKGKDLNEDISELVKGGLDARIQRSLDIVRVIGNHSVHPGQIDLRDDPATVATLFKLVNIIVDVLISQPKHIGSTYSDLPESARKAIEKRDKS
jgi:hypothetical protein